MIEFENPITGEKYNLTIGNSDFPHKMNWSDAKKACASLGKGWRLPSINELEVICKTMHKNGQGNFKNESYWSNEENSVVKSAWYYSFPLEVKDYCCKKECYSNVRPVKQL